MMTRVIPVIMAQFAEESAFLWHLRDQAVAQPHYSLPTLLMLDDRVEAHVDGLRVAGEAGWQFARDQILGKGRPGEVFAAGVLAFESDDPAKVQQVLAVGAAKPENLRGLVSALGWIDPDQAIRHIKPLLTSAEPIFRRAGIAAAATIRRNPGPALADAFASDDPALKARALRAAGELGVLDLQNATRANLKAKAPACRYWAAWSTALMNGNKDAVAHLQALAENNTPFAEPAAQMAVRRLPLRDARLWIKKLALELGRTRVAIKAIGALGDPDLIPWLIDRMKTPDSARVAGEAVSMITGVNISSDRLEGQKPEGFEAGPNDNPADGNVDMDPDENLTWPDPALALKWWSGNKGNLSKDTRHLLGRPIDKESLRHALKNGYQRQRAAAALELAILNPGRPLFEVRAPGRRQLRPL
jgi:uncharacterized protein (TIGR02270 family)